ncbi:EpsG family protein [Dickeya poaceiphila]|uniref:EpsG family protein n=1 Tax=Dickeya poaceiphila TaxID=568768 RepID=A0A5B8IAE5_9GAMM|nr:EpsG family protein [Dickeya poaceiphila]QDX31264.1 EpsG family protein [Dickeya poaceiphila]
MERERIRASFKILTGYVFLFLAIAAGLRKGNDPDYANYKEIYEGAVSSVVVDVEPAYQKLNFFFDAVGFGFEGLILAIALASVMMKCIAIIKYSEYFFLSLLIYISTIYLLFDVVAIRQGFAIAIIMLSLALWENDKKKALLLYVFAPLIHIASLVFLPVLLLCNRNYGRKTLLVSIAAITVIVTLSQVFSIIDVMENIPFIPDFLLIKLKTYSSYNKEAVFSFKQVIVSIFAYLVYTKVSCSRYVKLCCVVYIFGCLISSLFSSVGDIAFRIKWFFSWTEIIFLPYLIGYSYRYFRDNEMRLISRFLFFTLIFSMYFIPAYNFIESIHERGFSLIL